ncbi:hypothetical protein D6C76_02137 [Aureobasidium pullulans]|nr:hypothetical protein D6C76_02137 [Aureobasidium pullulans]
MLNIQSRGSFAITSKLVLLFFSILECTAAQQFLPIDWSETKHGPDGPWNALSVQVGGMKNSTPIKLQQVQVDLYPGSQWSSFIPRNVSCETAGSTCGQGTTWSPSFDSGTEAVTTVSVSFSPYFVYNNTNTNFEGEVVAQAITLGGKTVYQADLVSFGPEGSGYGYSSSITYPNGVKTLPSLGLLALNAGPNQKDMDQQFAKSDTNSTYGSASVWIPAGYLYNQSIIPSYSYGLQMGSAALGYPGSLYLGGYDKGRVIGPYTTYGTQNPTLLDIQIGVETGGSPFSFQNKTNLLLVDNDDGDSINVEIVPHSPSLYLPVKTCEALTKVLPIYFDQVTKYYLWNTSDPNYNSTVKSPSYLSFIFPPAPGASDNVTIKVPFKLLNLTLTYPIVASPVQYFPCQATVPNVDSGIGYALGRAFLQGAFVGWNTNTNIGWLAQAPGPGDSGTGLGTEGKNIANDATVIDVYDGSKSNYFAQSWAKHWEPIPSAANTAPTSAASAPASTAQQKSISTGAIAGIAIGGAVVVIALTAGLVICAMRRRRQRKTVKEIPLDERSDSPKTVDIMMESPSRLLTPPPPFTHGPHELHQGRFYQVAEMPSNREVQELHAESRSAPVNLGRRDVHELGLPPTPRI